jgi:ribonuclease BN (tRNA processing enzyme)
MQTARLPRTCSPGCGAVTFGGAARAPQPPTPQCQPVASWCSDHIGDLGELNLQTWAAGRPSPLRVYGGPGIDRIVDGFNEAYRLDQGYRTAHHTDKVMPPSTWPMLSRTIELGAGEPGRNRRAAVLVDRDLTVTAIEVDHAPIAPAYARIASTTKAARSSSPAT